MTKRGQCRVSWMDIAITLFFAASLMYNTSAMRLCGFALILLSCFICVSSLAKSPRMFEMNFLLSGSMVVLWYVIEMARSFSIRAAETLGLFFVSFCVCSAFSRANITKKLHFHQYGKIIFLVICFVIFAPLSGGGRRSAWKSIFTTTTFLGIFSCLLIEICLICFALTKEKIWIAFSVAFAYAVLQTRVRTAYIGTMGVLLITALILFPGRHFKVKKSFLTFAKWAAYAGIAGIVIIYPMLNRFAFFDELSRLTYQYTGKILMSGRQLKWSVAADMISERPIAGFGLDFSDAFSLSVHNSYLQILLQSGAVGFALVFAFINCSLNRMNRNHSTLASLTFLYTLVNLTMCVMEVMLFQGQVILQIIIWAIVGLGGNPDFNIHMNALSAFLKRE